MSDKHETTPIAFDERAVKESIQDILDLLATEHGDEAFVSDGYAYYQDAIEQFLKLCRAVHEDANHQTPSKIGLPNDIELRAKCKSLLQQCLDRLSWYGAEHESILELEIYEMMSKLDLGTDSETSPSNLQTGSSQRQSAEPLDKECLCDDCNICVGQLRERIAELESAEKQKRRKIHEHYKIQLENQENAYLDQLEEAQKRIAALEHQLSLPKVPQSEETRGAGGEVTENKLIEIEPGTFLNPQDVVSMQDISVRKQRGRGGFFRSWFIDACAVSLRGGHRLILEGKTTAEVRSLLYGEGQKNEC